MDMHQDREGKHLAMGMRKQKEALGRRGEARRGGAEAARDALQ